MEIFSAILLGVVQGLTEFLPISSTGHLILFREVLGVNDGNALAFDAILHLATAGAVITYFSREVWQMIQTVLRRLGRLPVNKSDMTLVYALAAGTVPAVVFGLLLEDLMESTFRSPLLVAVVLVAGSLFFMVAEYLYQSGPRDEDITVRKGLKVGLFQSLALIPGMSRSGASIAGGMLLGFSRAEAARFAFLLSIPVILGAGCKKLLELISSPEPIVWGSVLIGAAAAFFTGFFAIHFMLGFVKRHTLWPFIWYRIILACFVVFIVFFG